MLSQDEKPIHHMDHFALLVLIQLYCSKHIYQSGNHSLFTLFQSEVLAHFGTPARDPGAVPSNEITPADSAILYSSLL